MINLPLKMITALVRFGAVPEVARCRIDEKLTISRGTPVVVETHRGQEWGTVLDVLRSRTPQDDETVEDFFPVIRLATDDDAARRDALQQKAHADFSTWENRIRQWNIDVQLVDLEWTFDESKLIFYVLNDRGPECTKLAIQAAAAGFGIIEVQPVSADGLVKLPSGGSGGCGSCGSH